MKIRNQKLYNVWIRTKRSKADISALSHAMHLADYVEKRIKEGIGIQVAIEEMDTVKTADPRGITPLMYQTAMRFLQQCWEYGKHLKEH